MQSPARYARVIVDGQPAHLDRPFDYRIPDGRTVAPGQRVTVRFAGGRRGGWVIATGPDSPLPPDALLPLERVHGHWRLFDEADLRLFRWVADRYAAGLADVLRHALPERVAAVEPEADAWGAPAPPRPAARPPCPLSAWRPYAASPLLRAVAGHGPQAAFWWRQLPGDDRTALAADLVSRCLASGRSALVLVPHPASALPDTVLGLAGPAGVDLRPAGGSASDRRARYRGFLRCRSGHGRVAVGERSAVFAPLRDLGLVLVEDEANPGYKERRSPRHHAREVALARARMAGAVCVLGGDLPSASLWRLLDAGHVQAVAVDRAEERSRAPRVEVADLSDPRPGSRRARLSERAAARLRQAVRERGVAVVVAARGGEGTALACGDCRRRRACPVCDGGLGVVRAPPPPADAPPPAEAGRWACPSCGWEGAPFACPGCDGTAVSPLAAGAGRLASELARSYPAAQVVRMEGFDAAGPRTRPAIAVMTRGSVVGRPRWLGRQPACVAVLPDADAMLNRPALDAAEDALRLWLAVGRWSDHVVVQTREAAHPAVQALVRWDPEGFWRGERQRRAALRYPPHRSLVRVVAPVARAAEVARALQGALPAHDELLGPDPDGALLVKSAQLRGTLDALTPLRHAWAKAGRRVRVDVDPLLSAVG